MSVAPSPTLPDELPTFGTTLRIVSREYQSNQLFTIETTDVTRGSGTGIRTTRRHKAPDSLPSAIWYEVVEGFANGLAYPDRTTQWNDFQTAGGEKYGWTFRRDTLMEGGDRWRIEAIPGYVIPSIGRESYPDSSMIRYDGQKREIERRAYERPHLLTIQRKEWGPWGPTIETDSVINDSDKTLIKTRVDSSFWMNSQILTKKVYGWRPDDSGGGSGFLDSSTFENGKMVESWCYRLPRIPLDTPVQIELQQGDTVVLSGVIDSLDTTWHVRDSQGRDSLVYSRRDTARYDFSDGHMSRETDSQRGSIYEYRTDKEQREVYCYSYWPNNHETIDSTFWSGKNNIRYSVYSCDGTGRRSGCTEIWRQENDYSILQSVGTTHNTPPPRLTLRQNGRTLRWTGTVPDGAIAQLRSVDGRILASSRFLGGIAQVERTPAQGLVIWLVEADGRRVGEGGFLVR